MKGSEKQIKWAIEIQSKIAKEAQPLLGKAEHFDRVINQILYIDNASFWIDYRSYSLRTLLSSLQSEGLRNKGLGFSNTIKIDKTYKITETWEEIVADGKGGHKETKTKTW